MLYVQRTRYFYLIIKISSFFCDFLKEDRLTIGLLDLVSNKYRIAILGVADDLQYYDGIQKAENIKEIVVSDDVFQKIQLSSKQKIDEFLFSLAFLNEKGSEIFSFDLNDPDDLVSLGLSNKYQNAIKMNNL